jgi:C4-dicarboxylate-specific signal transduction histidine kinase
MNLVINGVQASASVTERPRELALRSETGNDYVAVLVRDSGESIDPDHAPRLFEAFFTTKPSGISMGLSICWCIIESRSGRVSRNNAGPAPPFSSLFPWINPKKADDP